MNPQQKEGNDGWKGGWEGGTTNDGRNDGWKGGRKSDCTGVQQTRCRRHNPQSRAFDNTVCFMHTAGYEIKSLHQNMEQAKHILELFK